MRLGLGSSFFLSGVMQGKKAGQDGQSDVKGIAVVNQDYRGLIKSAIVAADDTAKIIEPWDLVGAECTKIYPEGTSQADMFKDDADVRRCFQLCVDAAAASDVVISYLPEASMGSAVEIHAAMLAGKKILVVAPDLMSQNWVVRSYADLVFKSIDELGSWLKESVG